MKHHFSLILFVLVVLIVPSQLLAGGGPLTTFDDLAGVAQYNENRIGYFYQAGIFDESDNYWAGDQCLTWMYLVDNIDYYFQNEATFVGQATKMQYVNDARLKYETSATPQQIKKWRKAKKVAIFQLQQMAAWHSEFEDFKGSIAVQNRSYYCSVEQVCAPYMEPEYSKVTVSKKNLYGKLFVGSQVHLFSFYLSVDANGSQYSEDAVLQSVTLTILMAGDNFEKVHNCSLISDSQTLAYQGQPYVATDGGGYAQLVFGNLGGTYIPKGTTRAFDVRCDIDPLEEMNSYIQVGFIPTLGTSPASAIEIIGDNTAEFLEVTSDMEISQVLTN